MITKQEKEHSDFVAFCNVYFGQIIDFEQSLPPKPDIIFHRGEKTIGCELTTIFKDNIPGSEFSKTKKTESIRDKICDALRNWIVKNLCINLFIRITFKNKDIEGHRKEAIINNLINVLGDKISDLNLSEKSYLKIDRHNSLPSEVYSLSIQFSPELSKTDVTAAAGDNIPLLKSERILSNIRHKEKKLLKNNCLFDENWLLLVIQDYLFSSEFDINEKDEFPKLASTFDKVFLLLKSDKKVIQIK